LAGGGRTDEDGLVCVFGEKGMFIRFGVDGHSRDAQLPAGAHHPDGDLSPVGDQDLVEHSLLKDAAKVKPFWKGAASLETMAIMMVMMMPGKIEPK
jgi:hypothetical protein